MKLHQEQFYINTQGRGTYDITREVEHVVTNSGIITGLCHVLPLGILLRYAWRTPPDTPPVLAAAELVHRRLEE